VAAVIRSEDILLERVDLRNGVGSGAFIEGCSNVLVRNFSSSFMATNGVESRASYNTRLEFGTIWSNGVAQIWIDSSPKLGLPKTNAFVSVSNCIMGSFGIRRPVYELRGTLFANYNNLYLLNGALAALSYEGGFPREYDSAAKWKALTGQDAMSLSHQPRFANAVIGDFHLKSSAGRYNPATSGYAYDPVAENSPLLDAGDPLIACLEPLPNGGRVNLGRYGNTAEASLTPTNAALVLISFNDGGSASGTEVPITWLARGAATNAGYTVTLYFSADGGSNWVQLATNVTAADCEWLWDSTLVQQTVQGVLRIEGVDGTSVQNDRFFSVRNQPFSFYINDNSTTNDVYCNNVGNNANSGLSPDYPMADLNTLLAKYDLEGGDTVYIDTGRYAGLIPGALPRRIPPAAWNCRRWCSRAAPTPIRAAPFWTGGPTSSASRWSMPSGFTCGT
jgi:hypothetical protein